MSTKTSTAKSNFLSARSGSVILTFTLMLFAVPSAHALITGGLGNAPVPDRNWRSGAVDVANLKCREGWWEGPPFGGGYCNFLYRGDSQTFNSALVVFAKVRAPVLELIVRDGPAENGFLRDDKDPKSDTRYDWDFVIWDVRSFYDLNSNPMSIFFAGSHDFRQPLPPPRITVYVGGGGLIEWDKVVIPKGIQVTDQRACASGIPPGSGNVIAGNVFDMATSRVLSGAKVAVEKMQQDGKKNEEVASGQTDAEGRFRIEKIPAGVYRISVSAPAYATLEVAYEKFKADSYRAFDDIELSPAATMSGTVLDDTGKPIAGATVFADSTIGLNGLGYRAVDSTKTTSDEQGRFEITGLPTGFARPMCFAKDYRTPLGQIIDLPAKDISIRMGRTGEIRGKVMAPNGGPPARQVMVSLTPEGGNKVSTLNDFRPVNPDGTFAFNNVPPGRYTISARPNPGLAAKLENETPITVTAGKTEEIELKMP